MLQMRNKEKILIEEEKKTGLYHVQLLDSSGEVKKDLNVSPDFMAEVLFGNTDSEKIEYKELPLWLYVTMITVLTVCVFLVLS